jgi:PAS domain S-box-containing protein
MKELKERNRLEAIWKKAEFITNSSRELMTLINRHYIFEAANNAYCSAQGKSRDDIIGKTAAEIWGENIFNSFIKPRLDRCLRGELVEDEDWINFPRLGRRYFTITYYPYSQTEGRVTHVSVITHDITDRKKAEDALKIQERDLKLYSKELEEANTALRVFFKQHSDDQKKMEEKLQLNVNELVMPYIEKLRQQNMGKQYLTYLELLEINLQNIVSPFMKNLSAAYQNLTPQEIQIAEMIRQGKSSQEMAAVLNLSVRTVNTHRNNMRKKLKLTSRTMNLRSYLQALS